MLAAVVVVAWLLVSAGPASAHAELIASSPRAGTGVAQAPAEVVIRFTEPLNVGLSRIEVLDDTGRDVAEGRTLAVEGDRHAMRRRLGLLPAGTYTVRWISVSPLDGHTLKGSYGFGVGTAASANEVVRSNPVDSEGWLGLVGRLLALGGLVLWSGGLVLAPAARRAQLSVAPLASLARVGAGLTAVGSAALATSSAQISAGSLGAVDEVLAGSPAGRYRLTVIVAAAIAALLPRPWRVPQLVLAGVAVVAEAASGHAANASLPVLAVAVFAVHLVAVGVWVSAITASLAVRRQLLVALRAFFPLAAGAAVVVAASGSAAAALELTAARDLVTTGYGRALSIKTVVLVAMVMLGVVHHRRRTSPAPDARRVRRPVVGELLAAAVAVAVAAALVGFPNPPREVEAAEAHTEGAAPLAHLEDAPALTLAGAAGPFVVGLTITPPKPGAVEVPPPR